MRRRGIDIDSVVGYRGHRSPIRTEAEAWRDIIADRFRRGLPLSIEENREAYRAWKREAGDR
jgi:hypothetical protein